MIETINQELRQLIETAQGAETREAAAAAWQAVLDYEPNLIEAKIALITLEEDLGYVIESYEALLKEANRGLSSLDWQRHEDRPYVQIYFELGIAYMHAGLFETALTMFTKVFHADKDNQIGVTDLMMICYMMNGNWKEGDKFYTKYLKKINGTNRVEGQMQVDLAMQFLYIFLCASCNQTKDLEQQISIIIEHMPALQEVFGDGDILRQLVFMAEYFSEELELDPDIQVFVRVLSMLPPVVLTPGHVIWYRMLKAYEYLTNQPVENLKFIPHEVEEVETTSEGSASDINLFDGLTTCQKKSLTAAGLTSAEALAGVTKKEVLSLPRIGPKAVEKLVANGVNFKD